MRLCPSAFGRIGAKTGKRETEEVQMENGFQMRNEK
jgi:hypothetical protein